MAFNKTKAFDDAAKLVSQRKISQAIKQYLAIAEHDPHDLPLLNTIGDLCVREGNVLEALRQFHRLADAYTHEGFILKAIAIYKKIVKLDPRSVDPILKLADLYAGQKLSHEANEQYKQALALCQRDSLHDKAGQILQKLVVRDPANAAYRARLAEYSQGVGLPDEALRGYLEATGISFRQKNLAAANASLKKAVEIEPRNVEVALWQARLAAESGQFDEVNRIFQNSPELLDNLLALSEPGGAAETLPAILEALGKAFAGIGQWAKAEMLFRRLTQQDEHNSTWQSLLAESQEKQQTDRVAPPVCVLPAVAEMASSPTAERSQEATEQSSNVKPSREPAETEPQASGMGIDLSGEWESFVAAGPEPEPTPTLERYPLPAPPPEPASQSEVAMAPPSSAPAREETIEARKSASEPSESEPELPSFPAGLGPEKAEVEFYLDYGFLVEGGAALDNLARKYPGHPQVLALQERLAGQRVAQEAKPEPPTPPQAAPSEPLPSLFAAETAGGVFNRETQEPPTEKAFEPAQATFRKAESESRQIPSLDEADQPAIGKVTGEATDASAISQPPEPEDASVLGGLAQDLEKSWDDAEVSAAAEAQLQASPQPAPWTREDSALDDLVHDLGAILGEFRESASSLPAASPVNGEPGPSLFDSSLEELLSELNEGEESAAVDDTPQTHYNLGVAFREMGLLDEAIGEFQKVVKAAGGTDSAPRMLEACSLLGICFMEKQMPEIAIRWLTRALRSPGLSEETTMALTYDLGAAYEQSGDRKAALERFSEVYSLNIDYRDVAEKIQSLHSKRA